MKKQYHGAKYSDSLMPIMSGMLVGKKRILDMFGGSGKAHSLQLDADALLIASEIEYAYAAMGCDAVADATNMPYPANYFDAGVTSGTYGNGVNDNSNFKDNDQRNTYISWLRRVNPDAKLHPNNTGGYTWKRGGKVKQEKYKALHIAAYKELVRVLQPGGTFVLNMSDHISGGEVQRVTDWHIDTLESMHFYLAEREEEGTPRLGYGSNGDIRVERESVLKFILVDFSEHIERWRNSKELTRDPQLIAYVVRDWTLTKRAGLTDLAWAMCEDGATSRNDVLFLLDELHKHLVENNT